MLALPIFVPTVLGNKPVKYAKNITIVTNRFPTPNEKYTLVDAVKHRFGESSAVRIQDLSSKQMNELQVYDEIGQAVERLSGIIVLDLDNTLWGELATRFRNKMLATEAARSGRLFLARDFFDKDASESATSSGAVFHRNGTTAPSRFLMVADLYVPKVTFLGEETLAVIEVAGQINPDEEQTLEIVIRANEELVTTIRAAAKADATGVVRRTIEVPVSFLKAQTQVLSVQLKSADAHTPLDSAATTVFVAHGKTTVLHVAVGPDWSVRTLRQKLKFWPNLDLLSYYILRERWDDNSIPPNQLSLIEFPADKLFGEQLPNFHGIIAQNFFFDHYLGKRDAMNLVEYVRQGGRMFLQAGPLSFLSQDPAINALFPCKNSPEYVPEAQAIRWRIPTKTALQLGDELSSQVPLMSTSQYFKNCQPKDDAIVLAELASGDPILLAATLGKGLVVASLASDWHTSGTQARTAQIGIKQVSQATVSNPVPASTSATAAAINFSLQNAAAEKLTEWIIEFLQRRQDSGLRPPDLAGPRIFDEDKFLLTRSRGPIVQNSAVTVYGSLESGKKIRGRLITLPFMEKEGILLEQPIGTLAEETAATAPTLIELARTHENAEQASIRRGGLWPIHSRHKLTVPENQQLLEGVPSIMQASQQKQNGQDSKTFDREDRPLLEVYPFLLALALFLLFADTVLNLFLISSRNNHPTETA